MPDEKGSAASSAAVIDAPPQPKEVYDLTRDERTEWLKTGNIPPKDSPKKDASAPSKPAVSDDGKSAESGTADKTKPETEKRFNELLRERKEAREEAERYKAELEELRKPKEAAKDESKKAASSPAELPKEPERPKRPKISEFTKTEDYEAAMDKYDDAMLEYPAKKAAWDTAKAGYEKQQAEINERQKGLLTSWKNLADKGKESFGEAEWRKITDSYGQFNIYAGDPFEVQIRSLDPDTGSKFMQYMSLKPADVKRILGLPIREQFKELDALEQALKSELGGASKSDKSDEKPTKKEKEIPAAGKPPREAGGTAAAPEDEAEAALARGDGDAYRRIMNERDVAKLRAKRRKA